MRRTASEVIRNLESRIARLEDRTASVKFKVEINSDRNSSMNGSTEEVDLNGLKSLMTRLESLTLSEIESYLSRNPQDEFSQMRAEFWAVFYRTKDDVISLYNGTHTEEHELFGYSIRIKDASKFAFTLMGGHPLFKGMELEVSRN